VKKSFPRLLISLTTNGILLTKYSNELKSLGLDSLNVSLDTLDPDKYRYITRLGDINDVWEGVKRFLNEELLVKINVVAIRGFNDDEILDFVNLTKKMRLIVRFIEFMPITKSTWKKEDFLSADEIKQVIERKYSLTPLGHRIGYGPATYFKLPWGGVIGLIGAISHHFCDRCNRIRLTANGRLRTCLFGEKEIDLKEAMRRGADDKELITLIKEAISLKPLGWFTLERWGDGFMSKIGG